MQLDKQQIKLTLIKEKLAQNGSSIKWLSKKTMRFYKSKTHYIYLTAVLRGQQPLCYKLYRIINDILKIENNI